MALANFLVKLGLDATDYHAGLKKAESAAHHFAKENVSAIKGALAEAFTVGAIVEFTKSVVEAGAAIKDLAEQTGLTTDEVQELQVAAKNAGLDVEKYINALVRVKAAQAAAQSGDQAAANKFKALGISPNANPLDILRKAGEAKTASELAAAYDLIGERAGRILKSLGEIHELGPMDLISKEEVEQLDKADKLFANIKRRAIVEGAKVLVPTANTLGIIQGNFEEAAQFLPKRLFGVTNESSPLAQWASRMVLGGMIAARGIISSMPGMGSKADLSNERTAPADDPRLHKFLGFGVHRDGPTMDWRLGRAMRRAEMAGLGKEVQERFYAPVTSGGTDIGNVRLSGGANYFQRAQITALQSIQQSAAKIAENTEALNAASEAPNS